MSTFGIIFVGVLALSTALRLWLAWRQISYVAAHRAAVPPQFETEISLAEHQKAADYTVARTRFAMLGVAVEAIIIALGG